MSAARKLDWISLEEYLAAEEVAEIRHEYIAGRVFAMAGGTSGHSRIGTNIIVSLSNALNGKRCEVFGPDTRLRVDVNGQECVYYPDVSVICETKERSSQYEEHPVVLVEVLSPRTRRNDLRDKLIAYSTIPSVKVYIIIEQKPVGIAVHRRTSSGFVAEEYKRLSDIIPLPEIEAELAVAKIYGGMTD